MQRNIWIYELEGLQKFLLVKILACNWCHKRPPVCKKTDSSVQRKHLLSLKRTSDIPGFTFLYKCNWTWVCPFVYVHITIQIKRKEEQRWQILSSAGGQDCSTLDYWCHWWPPVVMMAAKHVSSRFDFNIIHILSIIHLYHKQLVPMITACDRPLLWWWLFFCQSTSLGGTFYLSMYVMICAGAIFRSLIWLLDFLWCKPKYWNTYRYTWKNWKISESCTRSASLMLHLWFNVEPCGDDWGCQVSSAINIIFPALKRTQHLFC